MKAYIFVLCLLSVNFVLAVAYKAGVVSSNNDALDIGQLVHEAVKENVDILVLPSDLTSSQDNYDETVKNLSKAAKEASLYLIVNLNEKTVCQKKTETVRSNLVFDRKGGIVSVYRKPVTNSANCTTSSGPASFTTDFGVTFGVKMEDDLLLQVGAELKDYVVAGNWASEIPLLSGAQFTPSWAFTADANVLSSHGIFAGKAGVQGWRTGALVIAELNDVGKVESSKPPVVTSTYQNYPEEDLSQYIIRPLDVEASSKGYKETVCHKSFCCEFDIKTSFKGSKQEMNYGLAAFEGTRHYGGNHYIGLQNCAVFACAGLYKRSCSFGSIKNNTVSFEKLSISAKFNNQQSTQYPLILSNKGISSESFSFITKPDRNQVSIEVKNTDDLLTFGIFGRDFAKDYDSVVHQASDSLYDYIFNEDVVEFFDYVWIKLRVLIFIVSIYVLEMM